MESLTLTTAQADAAAKVIALTFQDDPFFGTLFADKAEYRHAFVSLWSLLVRSSDVVVDTLPDAANIKAVAVWTPPPSLRKVVSGAADKERAQRNQVLRTWPSATLERFISAMTYLEATQVRLITEPHWYLSTMAVDPACQGQGYGSTLLETRLSHASVASWPCYLETQSLRTVKWYERHGFGVIEQFDLPNETYRLWAMRRN